MASLSTHVLDQVTGSPAVGLAVTLLNTQGDPVATATTDDDGRARLADAVDPGTYQLQFATGSWFARREQATFYPMVAIYFDVSDGQPHYHVPLLLSPFGYGTYRGS